MIMGIWRDLAAFVLLAHLVTLSRGSIDEKRALEEILAKNVSIVVIESKDNGPVDLEKLRNATSLVSGHGNSTVASNATDVVDENELVAELEEALVSAASSGQVIMIAPPADRGNSTNSLPGPVLVIETPSNVSKSLVNEVVSRKSKKRKDISPSLDQEIAQSQTRERSGHEDYADDEDLETLGDLLAVTEYEPQRIDVKRVDEKIPEITSDHTNSTLQSTIHPRPEETHYDVPKQRNPPRNYQRSPDDVRAAPVTKNPNDSSTPEPLNAATSSSLSTHTDREPTSSIPQDYKVERRKPAAPLIIDEKPDYPEIVRGPRNSEIIVPLTTRPPSTPRKLTYSEITRKNGPIGSQSATTSTFIPGFSGSADPRPRNINNFTNSSIPPRWNLHSSRVSTTPVSLPTTYYPFLHRQASSSFAAKTPSQPTLQSSAVPRATRRIDDYYSAPDYVTTNEAPQTLANRPLGYLTRYNQPSLVARQIPKARLYPAATEFRRTSEVSPGEKRSDEDSHEATSPGSPRTIPVRDDYDNIRLGFGGSRTTSRPPFVDYRKVYQREDTRHQPTNDYQNDDERQKLRHQPTNDHQKDRQRDNQSPQPTQSYQNIHQRQNERHQPATDYQKVSQRTTQQQPTVDYRNGGRSSIARTTTTPSYESYEEDEEEDATEESEEVRKPEATSQAIKGILPRSRNSPATTATPADDSYEDEEPKKPQPHQQSFATTGSQRPRLTTTPYVIPTRPVYQSSDYFARTPQPATPTSLLDNPIYQLHGVKTGPGRGVPNAIRGSSKDHQERRPPTVAAPRQTTRFLPHSTATSQRTTTPAYDSYDDSEEHSRPTTTRRPRNRNYVDHRSEKFAPNGYVDKSSASVYSDKANAATVASATQPRKQHAYDGPISDRFSAYQTESVSRLPLHTFNPERNSNFAAATAASGDGVTTPTYVDYGGGNEADSNDDRRRYVPAATKFRALDRRANLDGKNAGIRSTRAPDYESYEEGDEEVEDDKATPSDGEKLIELRAANYGSRVRPRVVVDEGRQHHGPSHSRVATASAARVGNVETNYDGRGGDSGGAEDEEEPVESVRRAEVEEAPYEDEAGAGHAEDQASHQTHAKAKKHGGGGGGEGKHEEGGGLKHEEDHHEAHGEKGDKGYKGYHEYDKGKKGHHDKESHDKEYDVKKGEKKKHKEEGGYHKEHHHGEKGDKEAEFAEKGEHQKGHSTKGQHVVHKKDEYEKKTEFYDESHEEDGDAKEGEYHHEHEHKKGGHEKKGHHDSSHHEDKYGEKGEHEKGHHYHEKKGHDGKAGKDQHHEHHEKYGKKGGHEEGLKWSHKKGDGGGGKKKGS